MLWIITAWVVSLIATYFLGHYIANITKKVAELEKVITMKVDKTPEPKEPVSELIDVTDPIQTAIYEHKLLMEKLNGKNNS